MKILCGFALAAVSPTTTLGQVHGGHFRGTSRTNDGSTLEAADLQSGMVLRGGATPPLETDRVDSLALDPNLHEPGIGLKRDLHEVTHCGSLNGDNLSVEFASSSKDAFDVQVNGISTSTWEDGCNTCGMYLEALQVIDSGWYCEANSYWGIWLKRTSEEVHCGSLDGENLRVDLASSSEAEFDAQVMGISGGSWEDGCNKCGSYLEVHQAIKSGWYCVKELLGIWLKRDPEDVHCGYLDGNNLSVELASLGKEEFDAKVKGIIGISSPEGGGSSWAEKCNKCGNYLEDIQAIKSGWYCEEDALGVALGIWLKRNLEDVHCGSLNGENLAVELAASGDDAFNAQVKGIIVLTQYIGSLWRQGCDECGMYLENRKVIKRGWYCEQNYNLGIWLKRGWPVTLHNAEWRVESEGSVPAIGDWRFVYRDGMNLADKTKVTNWHRDQPRTTEDPTSSEQFQFQSPAGWPSLLHGADALDIKRGADTTIIIGGWTNGPEFYKDYRFLQEYGNSKFDGNLLVLDWTQWNAWEFKPPISPILYYSSCENDRTMGLIMAGFLTDLMKKHNITASQVHCVGHSLGAHMCGYIGRTLIASGKTLGRISGMDPAGPDWTGARDRLTKKDASFVDVIHTNGGIEPRRLEGSYWLGNLEPSGHVDFYVNAGSGQPSHFCDGTCGLGYSHGLSNIYFAYSINHDMLGSLCQTSTVEECLEQGWERIDEGMFTNDDPDTRAPIGERATLDPSVESIPWSFAKTETTRAYFVFVSQTDGIEWGEYEMPLPKFPE